MSDKELTLSQTSLMCLQYKYLENSVEKGEIVHNEQFLIFLTLFSPHLENYPPFSSKLKLSSLNSLSLEESTICRFEKGLLITKDNTLNWSKLKACADYESNVAQIIGFVSKNIKKT